MHSCDSAPSCPAARMASKLTMHSCARLESGHVVALPRSHAPTQLAADMRSLIAFAGRVAQRGNCMLPLASKTGTSCSWLDSAHSPRYINSTAALQLDGSMSSSTSGPCASLISAVNRALK